MTRFCFQEAEEDADKLQKAESEREKLQTEVGQVKLLIIKHE